MNVILQIMQYTIPDCNIINDHRPIKQVAPLGRCLWRFHQIILCLSCFSIKVTTRGLRIPRIYSATNLSQIICLLSFSFILSFIFSFFLERDVAPW